MKDGLTAGIIGTGFMSRVHAQAILAGGNSVAGVVGSSLVRGQAAAADYPATHAFATVQDLLDSGVDVVHVCTPNALHFDAALAAIEAGVPVICEKPLATSVGDAVSLVRSAEDRGIVTGIPFIYRYYPLVREIRRRISQQPANRLWLLHGSYLQDWLAEKSATNWRVSTELGGQSRAFGDIGVHWCDLMEFVTGQRIVSVNATAANAFERAGGDGQNETEDGVVLTFRTDAGAVGSLVVSQASAGRRNRLWFSFDGPDASYSFDQETPERAWIGGADGSLLIDRDPSRHPSAELRPTALPAGHPQGYQISFNDFVADTYAAIQGETRHSRPTFTDGLRAALITDAVLTSDADGRWTDVPTVDSILREPATAR
jgi:predicted dehydrogenase